MAAQPRPWALVVSDAGGERRWSWTETRRRRRSWTAEMDDSHGHGRPGGGATRPGWWKRCCPRRCRAEGAAEAFFRHG
ncbi:gamma-butyrobetaine dioxygenase-like [Sesbania bispinosa]|nr:gamma-butyrobetaine dioxygenase-like [Sesbania bispinosa]